MAAQDERRLPLKVVLTSEKDLRKPEPGGSGKKVFGDVSSQTRRTLSKQLLGVQKYFARAFELQPGVPAVARLILKQEALAKSHRPSHLLDDTCPVIGVRAFGELLVSLQPECIARLADKISGDTTKTSVANLSTIERIEPYTEADALGRRQLDDLARLVRDGAPLKVRLFSHLRTPLDNAIHAAFTQLVAEMAPQGLDQIDYGRGLKVYRLRGVKPAHVKQLAAFVGTQGVSDFPTYRIVRNASLPVRPIEPGEFPPPDPSLEYPVVGLIDSGIAPGSPLDPWVVAHRDYVPPGDRDHDHGSFVGGLIVHGRRLNQDDIRFPAVASKIVDVAAIPKSGRITEDDLLTVLEEVVPQHPEVRVWNLSLSSSNACDDIGFSGLGMKLDDLQDRHGVTFVLAAGNYVSKPFRGWPPEDLGEDDRICAPADSLRGLTVASSAHIHRPNSRVKTEEPSPFSRRGPGPVFVPKPELSHYGGNCDAKGQYAQTGVMSFDAQGNVAENIGTSFASPLIATLLANVQGALAGPASINLIKALLVHSAMLGAPPMRAEELRYRGFGVPGDLARVLSCDPWSATLVFEPDLVSGYEFQKRAFPIPDALRTSDGQVKGEFIMTLVYDPPLNPNFGAEYCRSNVEVSLGTYLEGKDGKPHHKRQIPPEPQDVNMLYEKNLVEHGFKWSPVKVYRRNISRGVSGSEWRLMMSLLHRAGFQSAAPQGAALLVTMRDPDRSAPVYDQVVASMVKAGWASVDLALRAQVRLST